MAKRLYRHPRERWSKAKCQKLARRIAKDGLGTPYPWPGYLHPGEIGHYVFGLTVKYNGGIVKNGRWYAGEEWQLPLLPKGFEIVRVTNWGYRIIEVKHGHPNDSGAALRLL